MLIKSKIVVICFMLLVLCCTHKFFLSFYAKLLITTNSPNTEVTLTWKKKATGKSIIQTAVTDNSGRVVFLLKSRKVRILSIATKEDIKLAKFKGIIKYNYPFKDTFMYSRPHIDIYNFIVICALSAWIILLCRQSYKENIKIQKAPRFMNIEALRILMTLCVVSVHLSGVLHYWSAGWLAVEFFFILSGFLMTLTFNPNQTVLSFLKRKIIRFYPLIVFTPIIRGLFSHNIFWPDMFADFMVLNYRGLHWGFGTNSDAWYIKDMLIVMLFMFYLMKTQRKEICNIVIGVLVFFCYCGVVQNGWGNPDGLGQKGDFGFIFNSMFLRAIANMGLGYFIAQLFANCSSEKQTCSVKYSAFEFVVFLYAFAGMSSPYFYPENPLFSVICFAVLIGLFIQKRGVLSRFLEHPVFAQGAQYCLAVYLTHGCLVRDVLPRVLKKYSYFEEHLGETIFLFFLSAVIFGIIVHHVIEKPAVAIMKKWLE